MEPEDFEQLNRRIRQLESRNDESARERKIIMMLLTAIGVMMLSVKVEVDTSTGRRAFSFDGSAINVETVLQAVSALFVGTAGYQFLNKKGNKDGEE